jgi:hypothetical protein
MIDVYKMSKCFKLSLSMKISDFVDSIDDRRLQNVKMFQTLSLSLSLLQLKIT